MDFQEKKFSDLNVLDPFFDSLRNDYPGFNDWFAKKSIQGEEALVIYSQHGQIVGFIYLKYNEEEQLILGTSIINSKKRIKIGTFKLSEEIKGNRVGEGAMGYILLQWQDSNIDELYVTVFEKHTSLITLLKKYGFSSIGKNLNDEMVYIKNKNTLDFSCPFKSFPYLSKENFSYAKLIPIEKLFHDEMFRQSTLAKTVMRNRGLSVGNGITKYYVSFGYNLEDFKKFTPVFMYRIDTDAPRDQRKFKSAITTLCVCNQAYVIKNRNKFLISEQDFINKVKGKTVYSDEELKELYKEKNNITIFELIYSVPFGSGNNVNNKTLVENGLWGSDYPTKFCYDFDQARKILEMGKIDINDIFK